MGRPNADQSNQTSISHFSHPHPLQLSNLQTLGQILNCSACKLNISGTVYTCKACNFFLHPECYQLPQQIQHLFDQNHCLILQPKPIYPEGVFNCDACGNHGSGFSYHCSPCGVDLHTTCASLPVQYTHKCHHHQLSLTFSAPYPGNTFSCDICRRVGSKTWIYRCNICEFDVHLTCVATLIPGPALIQQPQQAPQINTSRSVYPPPQPSNFMNPPNMGANNYGVPRPQPVVMGQPQNQFGGNPYQVGVPQTYNNLNQPAYGASVGPVNAGGLGDQIVVATANGIASGVAQSATQAILQGVFGGGSGGGGGGGGVGIVDFMVMGAGGPTMDGGSFNDGGYGGTDGGY